MGLIDIKNTLLKYQLIFRKYLQYVRCTVHIVSICSPVLISPVVSVSRIFTIHQEHLFSGTPESVCYSFFFFYCNVLRKNLLSLLLCLFKKSDSLYLFRTKSLLLIVIDKVTIIESAPFSLVAKGAFVTFGKICLCVKSHSFIFSLIPRCPLSLNAQFL